jgi:iron complex outermembrane recepter protein
MAASATTQDVETPMAATLTAPGGKAHLSLIAMASSMCLVPLVARAQDDAQQPYQLETVTITAQRRPELLSRAPFAVSVINQSTLDAQGITVANDIWSTVPNMRPAANGFAIRGIGSNDPFGSYATVAVQVDGIYEPNFQFLTLGMYDIDRIEVLRGPQGTAYGRNATAGVVNIETARPKSTFEAFGDVAYGNYRDRTARGVVNVPVSDDLRFRLSAMKRKSDGYVDGGAASRRYDETDVSSVRLGWQWQASPSVLWRASLTRADDKGTVSDAYFPSYTYYPNADLSTGVLGEPVIVTPGGNILGYHTQTDISKNITHDAFRSSLSWQLADRWSITYLAGVTRMVNDGADFATSLFFLKNKDWITKAQSHEIDVNYESDALKAVGGLYHYRDRTTGAQEVDIGDAVAYPLNTALPPPVVTVAGQGFEPSAIGIVDVAKRNNASENKSNGIFGQFTWGIAPAWRVTAGARYTRDTFSTNGDSQACAFGTLGEPNIDLTCGVPLGPPVSAIADSSSNKTTWRLGLEHDLTAEHLLYGLASTGYRGGGATANVAPEFQTYKPETLTNIEAGWRARLRNNSLGLSATVFNMDYRDLQVRTIGKDVFGNLTPVIGNAATARVRGVELEGDWLVTRKDRIQAHATYLDTRFGTFLDPVAVALNPGGYNIFATVPVPHVNGDYSGHRLPDAPRLALRGRYSRTITLDTGAQLIPSAQIYWESGSYPTAETFPEPGRGYREAYHKTDLGLTYVSADRRWTGEAYVYNLENEKVYAYGKTIPLHAATTASNLPPRTFFVRLGYRFD